jgi:hypothetical protein
MTTGDDAAPWVCQRELGPTQNQGRFILDGYKWNAVVNCIATARNTHSDAYSKINNNIAFVRSGMFSSSSSS